jgi:hypothetical protein
LAIGLGLMTAPAAHAKPETPKQKDIRKLLGAMGSGKIGMQVLAQMVAQFKAAMPSVPDKFWADFVKEVNAQELLDLVVPVYDKHLSHAEIQDIAKFYESSAGKKLVSVLPAITQESMAAGQAWGTRIGEKVAARLKKKGY